MGTRLAVHGSNVAMLAFYALWCVVKPEAANYTGAVLVLLMTVIAGLCDWLASRAPEVREAAAKA